MSDPPSPGWYDKGTSDPKFRMAEDAYHRAQQESWSQSSNSYPPASTSGEGGCLSSILFIGFCVWMLNGFEVELPNLELPSLPITEEAQPRSSADNSGNVPDRFSTDIATGQKQDDETESYETERQTQVSSTHSYKVSEDLLDGQMEVYFPYAVTEDSDYMSDSQGRSVIRYNATNGDIRFQVAVWVREGMTLENLSHSEQQQWLDEVSQSIYQRNPPDDTVPLALSNYPGRAEIVHIPSNNRISRARILITDQLVITMTASNPAELDAESAPEVLRFLKSLTLDGQKAEVQAS